MGGDLLGRLRVPALSSAGAPAIHRVPARHAVPTKHAAIETPRVERRRALRRVPERQEPLARVRLRAGKELDVVNICDTGVLVEGTARLHPGAHVDVHVVTSEGRVLVRSRVVRAFVSRLETDAIRYSGALTFEQPIDTTAKGQAA